MKNNKRRLKVFIASPYSQGDVGQNVAKHLKAANLLINAGYIPFIPLLYHFQHIAFPQDEETWKRLDMEWLKVCDCVLRLPGKSGGADDEAKEATSLNIPVFYNINTLLDYQDHQHLLMKRRDL